VEAYSWSTIDINFTFTAISAYTKVKKKEKMKKVTILIAVVIFGMSLISTLSPYALAQLPTEKPSLDRDMEVVKNNEAVPTLSIPDKRPVGGNFIKLIHQKPGQCQSINHSLWRGFK
jgi:hypothetical protein